MLARCETRSQNSQPLNNAVVDLGRQRKRAVGRWWKPMSRESGITGWSRTLLRSVSDSGGRQRCKPFEWRMSSATYGGPVQDPESLTGGPPWAEVERPVMCSSVPCRFASRESVHAALQQLNNILGVDRRDRSATERGGLVGGQSADSAVDGDAMGLKGAVGGRAGEKHKVRRPPALKSHLRCLTGATATGSEAESCFLRFLRAAADQTVYVRLPSTST